MLSSNMTFSKVILCLNLTTPSALPNFFETCCRNQIQINFIVTHQWLFPNGRFVCLLQSQPRCNTRYVSMLADKLDTQCQCLRRLTTPGSFCPCGGLKSVTVCANAVWHVMINTKRLSVLFITTPKYLKQLSLFLELGYKKQAQFNLPI